jgi:hypothetical protein
VIVARESTPAKPDDDRDVHSLTSGRDETGDEIGRPVTGGASGVTGPGGGKLSACDAYGARNSLLSHARQPAGRFPPSL